MGNESKLRGNFILRNIHLDGLGNFTSCPNIYSIRNTSPVQRANSARVGLAVALRINDLTIM